MIEVRRCTVDDLVGARNYQAVVDEYAAESSISEMGAINPQLDTYRMMEKSGMFFPIGAFVGTTLVGFIQPIAAVVPHYGKLTVAAESFFVIKEERRAGLGLRLLAEAENLARDLSAKAFLLSSPTGGALSQVMQRKKSYRQSNDVFVRALV